MKNVFLVRNGILRNLKHNVHFLNEEKEFFSKKLHNMTFTSQKKK